MLNLSILSARTEAILTTLTLQEIRERAEEIFPELRQIALATSPEERAPFVSALRDRLSAQHARDKIV